MIESAKKSTKELLDFVDAGPSPWHAIARAEELLKQAGFCKLNEADSWNLKAGDACYVTRYGASLLAFLVGEDSPAEAGFHIAGAHTDSPTLRLKAQGASETEGMLRLGVEVYGGPILATFADRDLDLAGRVMVKSGEGPRDIMPRLFQFGRPVVTLPTVAIHMDRGVNEKGLMLDKQNHLPLLAGELPEGQKAGEYFRNLLAAELDVDARQILSWELNVSDCQKGALVGLKNEFYQSPRLDNLSSTHAAIMALIRTGNAKKLPRATSVIALFDHEEIGSRSARGADGAFVRDLLHRLCVKQGDEENLFRALSRSLLVSVDMSHAFHPNRPELYEPDHRVRLNGGPVIKINANRRYATDAWSEAWFASLCESADVPVQKYIHRTDLPCGSTIGPMSESLLGISAVDVGNPVLSMHSIRETGGVLDHEYMIRVLEEFMTAN